jgi:hypothetical protein
MIELFIIYGFYAAVAIITFLVFVMLPELWEKPTDEDRHRI